MVSKILMAGAMSGLGLAISGCATAASQDFSASPVRGAYLLALRDVPAPQGVAEFCNRNPDECGGGALASDGAGLASGGTAAAPDQTALFLALLASHGPIVEETVSAQQPKPARLTPAGWRLLAEVNGAVNAAIDPISDEDLYGVPDYWARPLEAEAPARGDCEDYALEKRARLIASGWPAEALSVAVAMSERGVHATLIAHTDRGDFVLDNFFDQPRAIERAPYRWLSMQTGGDFRTWRGVRVVAGERRARGGEA